MRKRQMWLRFLNMANQMNNEEQDEAKALRSKAGDNQALVTMADTLTQDHKANQVGPRIIGKAGERHVWILISPIRPNRIDWITSRARNSTMNSSVQMCAITRKRSLILKGPKSKWRVIPT